MKPNKKKWIGAVGGFLLAVIVSSQVLIGCANNNNHDPSYYGNHFGMNCPTPEMGGRPILVLALKYFRYRFVHKMVEHTHKVTLVDSTHKALTQVACLECPTNMA